MLPYLDSLGSNLGSDKVCFELLLSKQVRLSILEKY